jgi:hypothetical protein
MGEEMRRMGRYRWMWAVLAAVAGVAVWHAVDFESDPDGEYPAVIRPTYSPFPPAAYRLAEPGDTLDRMALYLASLLIAGTGIGVLATGRDRRPNWVLALVGSVLAWWYAATPGPSPSGWHTLGWRAITNPNAPFGLRLSLGAVFVALVVIPAVVWATGRGSATSPHHSPRVRTIRTLILATAGLALFRLIDPSGLEPAGYWSRWGLVLAEVSAVMAMGLGLAELNLGRRRLAAGLAGTVGAVGLISIGLGLIEYHRPIPRLKQVVPGRIFISAMPDYRGLERAQARHKFKTIINLFDENGPQRSKLWPQEMAFVRDHPEIRYLRSPGGAADDGAFLDETLAVVQDPNAWPVLVHCHGCMDRTPAWLGIYRFVVERRTLTEVFREIEAHRGYRPKASVTLLYHHVLPRLAPDRYALDPVWPRIAEAVRGVPDPYASERRLAISCPTPECVTTRRGSDEALE